jgi:hypothetical protein
MQTLASQAFAHSTHPLLSGAAIPPTDGAAFVGIAAP